MIRARNLTKRYGATVALDDLSFDVLPSSAMARSNSFQSLCVPPAAT